MAHNNFNQSILFPHRIQYKQLVEPITPPSQESEATSPDKYLPNTNQPIDTTNPIQRLQYLYPSLSWYPKILIDPMVIEGPRVHVIFPQQIQYQGLTKPITPPGQEKEGIDLDKWYQELSRPQKLTKPTHYWTYPSLSFHNRPLIDPMVIEGPRAHVIFPQQIQYQSWAFPMIKLIPEIVELDKWYVRANEPRWDRKHFEYLYPSFSIDTQFLLRGEHINMDKWFQELSHTIWSPKHWEYLYPSLSIDTDLLTQHEQIDMSKWYQELQRPPKGPKHWEYLYPPFSIDTKQLTLGESVLLNRWYQELSTPPKRPKATPHMYPSLFWQNKILIVPMTIEGPRAHVVFYQQFQYQKYAAVYEPSLIRGHIWVRVPESNTPSYTKDGKPTGSYSKTAKPTGSYVLTVKPVALFSKGSKPTTIWVVTEEPPETTNTF